MPSIITLVTEWMLHRPARQAAGGPL